MNIYSKYFVRIVVSFLFVLFFTILINFKIDTYYAFNTPPDIVTVSSEPNTRVLKFRTLTSHCQNFEAIVFGNSRAVAYRTKYIHDLFGLESYNFAVSIESFYGILRKLQWLINNNCGPKVIFLPISADLLKSYSRDYSLPPYDLLRMDHPGIVDKVDYKLEFYKTYLLSPDALIENITPFLTRSNKPDIIKYNFLTGDVYYLWDTDFPINNCSENLQRINKAAFQEALKLIIEIKDLAQANEIDIALLWNPQPINYQVGNSQTISFLKSIAPIFSRINRLPLSDVRLQDSNFYHDKGHFKDILAKDVLLAKNSVDISTLIEDISHHYKPCQLS